MWWSRRALLVGGAAAALAGCGFRPAYGPGGGARRFRGAVEAEAPDTDEGFAFVARIEDRLGRPGAAPRYRLGYTIGTEAEGLAIDQSDNVTRFTIEGVLGWTLREGDAVLLRGEERAFAGYSAGDSTLSALESERDARRRLMVMLADRVVARLLAGA